jgi:NADPH:quinone reductase-like Zn-dependent oxidoreductase
MRAVRFHEFGGPEVLRVEQVEDPQPRAGEVLVEVRAAALNHLDLWIRRGLPMRIEMPHVGGVDFAGVVRRVGDAVRAFAPGDEVVGYPLLGYGDVPYPDCGEEPSGPAIVLGEQRNGAFCELLALPEANFVRKPASLSFEEAASVPVVFVTAWTMLCERARLQKGETLLVLGAGSGVGTAAVQIGRHLGARVIAATRSEAKVDALAALGAEVLLSDRPTRIAVEVSRRTERRGAEVVFEHLGGPWWPAAIQSAAAAGRIVSCGATADRYGQLDLRVLFARQLQISGVTLGPRRALERVLELIAGGRLRPVIDSVLPLEACRDAHERLEAGGVFGKIVLRVERPGP